MVLPSAIVTLREITQENFKGIIALKVTAEQEKFVTSNAVSLAQAHFYPEVAWFRAIYADETPVGFVMLEDDPIKASYFLWRFMIDARFQKCGFGQCALELLIQHVKIRPGAKVLLTSCVPGEGSPGTFYEQQGFVYTGEKEEDELMMQREL